MWRSLWSNSWLVSTLVVRGNRAGGYSEHLLFYYPYYLSLLYLFSRQQCHPHSWSWGYTTPICLRVVSMILATDMLAMFDDVWNGEVELCLMVS